MSPSNVAFYAKQKAEYEARSARKQAGIILPDDDVDDDPIEHIEDHLTYSETTMLNDDATPGI